MRGTTGSEMCLDVPHTAAIKITPPHDRSRWTLAERGACDRRHITSTRNRTVRCRRHAAFAPWLPPITLPPIGGGGTGARANPGAWWCHVSRHGACGVARQLTCPPPRRRRRAEVHLRGRPLLLLRARGPRAPGR